MKNLNSTKSCSGKVVGSILKKDGKYLMLYRKANPQGLAGIAGHIEDTQTPEQALLAELEEESSLKAKTYDLVFHKVLSAERCGYGTQEHEWWVYMVEDWEGQEKLMEPAKHTFIKFMSVDEIKEYSQRGDIDPAWGNYILPALKIL